MPATFDLITSTTVPSDTNSVSFSSFSGYTDLVFFGQWSPGNTTQNDVYVKFNSNSANYYWQQAIVDNATVVYNDSGGANTLGIRALNNGVNASPFSQKHAFEINIFSYANSGVQKHILSRFNGYASSGASTGYFGGVWNNTAAVTTIDLIMPAGGVIKAGSIFSLYGILKA